MGKITNIAKIPFQWCLRMLSALIFTRKNKEPMMKIVLNLMLCAYGIVVLLFVIGSILTWTGYLPVN